jgi:Heterokaryon incompatibility protein (HET)
MFEDYVYEALRQPESSAKYENAANLEPNIRLLILKPGQDDQLVECELKDVSLKEKPRYEALSYVCGASVRNERVFCNGKVLWFTKSLLKALYNPRNKHQKCVFWIDKVYIYFERFSINNLRNRRLLMPSLKSQTRLLSH